MPTSTKVKNLNINELTEAQYDSAVLGGVIGANELSILTDVSFVEPSDLATVATSGSYNDLTDRPTNLVSTNTAQTISGLKTFSGDITLSGTTSIKNNTGGTNYTMLYRDASTIHVGGSTSVLKLEGSGTRPAYNNDSLALISDITGGLPSQTGHSGEFLTTDGTDASWAAISGGLPSQTGNSGKFLTTDGTDASWSDKPLVNTATGANSLTLLGTPAQYSGMINIGYNTPQSSGVIIGNNITGSPSSNVLEIGINISGNVGTGSVVIGKDLYCRNASAVVIGNNCNGEGIGAIAIGACCKSTANGAIQIGWTQNGYLTNSDTNTFKVGNNNGNFEMMSADGTIPTARLTKVNTTATLTSAGWSGGSQTVTVSGVTATGIVFVSPDPTDQAAYTSAGIIATAQSTDSITFTCTSTPNADIDVVVIML